MSFATPRLSITPLSVDDILDIHQMNSFEEVARFNTVGVPKSVEDTKALLHTIFQEESGHLGWAIRQRTTGEFIGQLGMRLAPERFQMAEIYYSLTPSMWGQGYMTEAVKALLHYGFNTLQLHRIEAGCAVDNIGSIRVLEKVGMKREGQKRKVLPLRSGWSDNYEYAVLEEDIDSGYIDL